MDDEDRSANRQQVRREVVIQDVGPPPVRVASPKLRTHGIGLDLGELGVSLGGGLRRSGELEGLAEGPARRRGEDDDRCRADTGRQHRYCGAALRTAEQDETPVPRCGPLHLGQYALVVGHALADGVVRMERRGAVSPSLFRVTFERRGGEELSSEVRGAAGFPASSATRVAVESGLAIRAFARVNASAAPRRQAPKPTAGAI